LAGTFNDEEVRVLHRILLGAAALLLATLPQAGAQTAGGKVQLHWFGQAAFKITTPGGKVIMVDPFLLKNPKTPDQHKDLEKLGKLDLILVTHGHFDHMADAPALAKQNKVPLWAPPGLQDTFVTLDILPADLAPRMNKSGTVQPLGPGISLTMVRAEHSSELRWVDPITGKERSFPGGEPVGWILQLENGYKIYHMGDTGLFGDLKLIGDYYKPDLVLIPIGGHFTMGPQEAAYAVKEMLKPKDVVPMHYGTFPPLKGTPQEFVAALGQTTVKVHTINPGDQLSF
jgi:L-ascorbate metabolism protein UlaG (beta-lactamase superfamily)